MKIKTLIIDDEPQARETLRSLLSKLNFPLSFVGEAWDISSGIQAVKQNTPDLIFLDIQLKDGNAFDLIERLDNIQAQIIFVTAYDQYAIQAFQMCAFGYLLKPISIIELEKVLERFLEDFQLKKLPPSSQTKILIENFRDDKVKKLVLQNVNGFKIVPIDQILYLKGEINYTRFYLKNGSNILTSRTLKDYSEALQDYGFLRTHQSYLINLSYVVEYIKGEGGIIVMENGDELKVSRRRKKLLLEKFIG